MRLKSSLIYSGHIRTFEFIAPIYGLFFQRQVRNYRRVIRQNATYFTDGQYRILDIGCGTGALAFVLSEFGQNVTGVDGSPRMIKLAKRFNRKNQTTFQVRDVLDLYDPANDLSAYVRHYDLVVASYVLHGLQKEQRMALYGAMKLMAAKRVVIMDYNQKPGILVSVIEWLERGDYFNFIKSIETEMKNSFSQVHTIQTGKRSAWYICECDQRP
jgi:2-polyprenyl-3-methyl-5-hydroxy-6-metoxy-1,4-benzoquinol methylase